MAHLGARITRIAPGRVPIELPGRPEVTQQHGYFHAGATSAIGGRRRWLRRIHAVPREH